MKQEFDYGKANKAVHFPVGGIQRVTPQERGDFYVPKEDMDTPQTFPENEKAKKVKKILLVAGITLAVIALFAVGSYLAG